MPDSVTVWVARDYIGHSLFCCSGRPRLKSDGYYYLPKNVQEPVRRLNDLQIFFPALANLRPEDGPKRIKLTLEVLD